MRVGGNGVAEHLSSRQEPMDIWETCVPTVIFEKAIESMRTHQPVPVNMPDELYLPDGKLPSSIEKFGDVGL